MGKRREEAIVDCFQTLSLVCFVEDGKLLALRSVVEVFPKAPLDQNNLVDVEIKVAK